MSILDRIFNLRNRTRRKTNQIPLKAVLGDADGLIPGPLPGTVYVQEQSGTPGVLMVARAVLGPTRTLPTFDPSTPVILAYNQQGNLYVSDVDHYEMLATGADPVAYTMQQASASTQQTSIETLAVIASNPPDLSVHLNAWNPVVNNVYYELPGSDTDGEDLSGYVPVTDYERYVVLFVLGDYETVGFKASTPELSGDLNVVKDAINECLSAAAVDSDFEGATAVFAVKLVGDQEEITPSDLQVDGRPLQTVVSPGVSTSITPGGFLQDYIDTSLTIPEKFQGFYKNSVHILPGGALHVKGRLHITGA